MAGKAGGLSRSRAVTAKVIHAGLTILKEQGGEMPMRDLMDAIEERVEFDEWERERYEKTDNIRWQSILHFQSVGCVKAGWLVKKKGVWYITPEGEDALKLGPVGLLETMDEAYKVWKAEQDEESPEELEEEDKEPQGLLYEKAEQEAQEAIETFIHRMDPYAFQDLVAALLRGMGYYTPVVAPKGKDGGIDVVAYRDPLGTESPRILVQVKHRENTSASVMEVRELMGLLQKDGAVGIFVSTGGFSLDAKSTARTSHAHVELIDLQRFITLWTEFYPKMDDDDKALMPLTPIYFLSK